jgi:hypothetical protein
LFTKDDNLIPLTQFNLDAVVRDSYSVITYTHHYHNTFENPMEVTFLFPTINEMTISSLKIQIDDELIIGKVAKIEDVE